MFLQCFNLVDKNNSNHHSYFKLRCISVKGKSKSYSQGIIFKLWDGYKKLLKKIITFIDGTLYQPNNRSEDIQ